MRIPLLTLCLSTIVANLAVGQRLLPLKATLRLGSADGLTALSAVRSIAVSETGEIYVLQHMEGVVKQFDARGKALRTFGRRGNGPGEFVNASRIGLAGRQLWVVDQGNNRITVFDTTAKVFSTLAVPPKIGRTQIYARAAFRDLTVFALAAPAPTATFMEENSHRAWVRVRANASRLDTLAVQPVRTRDAQIEDPNRPGMRGMTRRQFFSSDPATEISPSGDFLVQVLRPAPRSPDAAFELRWISPDGEVLRNRRFRTTSVKTPKAIVDSLTNAVVEVAMNTKFLSNRDDAVKAVARALYLPEYQPPIRSIVIGKDGSLWLERELDRAQSQKWTVVRKDGRIYGDVALPRRARVLTADTKHVYVLEADELDVPVVVRYAFL